MRQGITERTLYPELSRILEANGFENISDIGVRHGYFDFECFYKSKKFIVEVKIGTGSYFKNLLRGITQAWSYCQDVKGDGILVMEYPAQVRTPLFIEPKTVRNIATETKVNAIVLSHFFNESFSSIKPSEVFSKLRSSLDDFLATKETKTSFKLVIEALRVGISVISEILRIQRTRKEISELIDTVVGRFDLFLGLGQIEKTKKATDKLQLAAIDLIPYLLSNQILFYRIFSETTSKVSKLDENKITSIQDLKDYFKEITDINYKAIYSVDIVTKIPEQEKIIEEIREIIKAINILKPEFVKHDLLGRLYHELLPKTTRKVLAAFYTNPVAADILAGLTIDKWEETAIDPSCGSGTLLVSAYKRKLSLYKQKTSTPLNLEELHRKFTEEQITGIDIIPFASHLTAVNLAAQTPNAVTNKVRVACQDSLELQKGLTLADFTRGEGFPVESFRVPIQKAFLNFGKEKSLDRSGAVSAEGEQGAKFLLKPVDVVLMNPPFSDREKMPKWYREHLKSFKNLIGICGNQINFWGFFMVLTHYLLKNNGKMGLVIPINIARGEATKKIRDHVIENYHIQYILKTTKELAFSEGAAFRDILFIARRRKPQTTDLTGIVFLKRSIKEMGFKDAEEIIMKIREIVPEKDYVYSDNNLDIHFVDYKKILESRDNLMKVIGGSSSKIQNTLDVFVGKIRSKHFLTMIQGKELKEGFGLRPSGISSLIVVTRPVGKSRISRSTLLLGEEFKDKIEVFHKLLNKKFSINRSKLSPSFRSVTAVKRFDISGEEDYIITDKYPGLKEFQFFSKYKDEVNWRRIKEDIKRIGTTNIAIPNRINLSSPNTHLFSVFSEKQFIPVGKFFLFKPLGNSDKQKALAIFLNSVCMITQVIYGKSETTGAYFDIKKSDYINMFILNFDKLPQKDKQILIKLFTKLKSVEFPSILDQLASKFPARVELDKTVLKILGFSDKEISKWLPKIYEILIEELEAMRIIK